MPSMSHEGPLDLVRDHPEIAVELVRGTVGVELPGQLAVSLAPTDMSAVVPVQYLADMVVLISDPGGDDDHERVREDLHRADPR